MTENNNDGTRKRSKRVREGKLLLITILIPIVAFMLIGGGIALWKGFIMVLKVIVPNLWVVLVYAYFLWTGIIIGRMFKK